MRNLAVRVLVFAVSTLEVFSVPARAQAPDAAWPTAFQIGEELVYNVRYGFIDLGQIKIRTTSRSRTATGAAWSARADINSYPKVPFVDLHAVFESVIDSAGFSRWFTGKMKEDDRWDFARYVFDYDRHVVRMEIGRHDSVIAKRETLAVHTPHQDGLSLFFLAREQLLSGRQVAATALVTEKQVQAHLDFTRRREEVEIDAVEYPIDVLHFDGRADFVGIFGLTGDFEGWFSNDVARVPILAKMHVIIGSVTIELMQWTRAGWTPPRAP
jgi:hypothetical protein